jgi:hypothetical protein
MSRVEGTALVLEAEANPGTLTSASESQAIFMDFNILGSRKYFFALEVRLPGQQPYRVEGKFKVPKRAENTGLLQTNALTAGIEVPVRVDPSKPDDVEIDWKAYRSKPGRVDDQRAAHQSDRNVAMQKELKKNPEVLAKLRAGNKLAVQGWVGAVQAGSLSREEFEAQVKVELETGRMDPADAEAARAMLGD